MIVAKSIGPIDLSVKQLGSREEGSVFGGYDVAYGTCFMPMPLPQGRGDEPIRGWVFVISPD